MLLQDITAARTPPGNNPGAFRAAIKMKNERGLFQWRV
jgi:hypothetical protein